MDNHEKQQLLDKVQTWFREVIAPNHATNIKRASKFENYNVNPFLISYLAGVVGKELTAKTVAKALLLPRALGTSITTSFGNNVQSLLSNAFSAYGSTTQGIDIEFIDALDNRKKYCQLKLGPETINRDDVDTIVGHFSSIQRLARTNHLDIRQSDLVVGVLYGTPETVNANYKAIQNTHHYNLYVGKDFWHRFTGDENFYYDFQKCINEVALEFNLYDELVSAIEALSVEHGVREIAGEYMITRDK